MKSFSKRPKWNITVNKNVIFNILPSFKKSYSLCEPDWKDKFETPRCESVPYIFIDWLFFSIYCYRGNDNYWERWLLIHKYHNGNEEEARKKWRWVDIETNENTWYMCN